MTNRENYNPKDIVKKYGENSVKGEQTFKKNEIEEVPPKEYWEKEIREEEHLSFYFDESSNKEITDRIISRISEIGQKHEVSFWLAGDYYPIHSTLCTGYPGDDVSKKDREELYKKIESDQDFKESVDKINKPLEIQFKYLILNGNNITLNAENIPDEVFSFRQNMKKIFQKYNLPIKARDNILHITLARVKGVPRGKNSERELDDFVKDLRGLRHEISKNPVLVKTTKNIFVGTNMPGIPEK